MARALEEETKAAQPRTHTISSEASHKSMCARCGGLMVTDFYMDLISCIGETEFAAQRCVQCGEIVDPVILCNRGITHDPVTGDECARGSDGLAQQKQMIDVVKQCNKITTTKIRRRALFHIEAGAANPHGASH
jgi:hypothetical protein